MLLPTMIPYGRNEFEVVLIRSAVLPDGSTEGPFERIPVPVR